MKGQELLDSDELSLFEWYVREHGKVIDLMLAEERAYIEKQVGAGLDFADVNSSGMDVVEYYIKRAYYADVIYLTSLLELYLSRASKKLELVLGNYNVIFQPGDLRGSGWERHKKFLEGYGRFTFRDAAWDTLLTLVDVRNILVHYNGFPDPKRNLSRIENSPGIKVTRQEFGCDLVNVEIVVDNAYINHCLSAFRSLVEHIDGQINEFIERTLRPQ